MLDMELVRYGQREPLEGLLQQGRISAALAEAEAAILRGFGWTDADTRELKAGLGELEAQRSRQLDERRNAREATQLERNAMADARAFKRRLDLALRRYFRNTKSPAVLPSEFQLGSLRTTPAISTYLLTVRVPLLKIASVIGGMMGSEDPIAELDKLKAELDEVQVIQERAKDDLPEETAAVNELKGRVLRLINNLNDTGLAAFDGNALMRAKFNKDHLLAARTARPKKEEKKEEEPLATLG